MPNCIQSVLNCDVEMKDKTRDLSHSVRQITIITKWVNTIRVDFICCHNSTGSSPVDVYGRGKNTATSTNADRRWRQDTVAVEMWNTLGRSATGHPCTSQSHSRMSHSVPVHLARCVCVDLALFMPSGFRLSHHPVSLMWSSYQLDLFSSGWNSTSATLIKGWAWMPTDYTLFYLASNKKQLMDIPINQTLTMSIFII